MTAQIACFLTTWDGDGTTDNPYRPTFVDNLQDGEYWSNNLDDLLDVVRQINEDVPSEDVVDKHSVVQSPVTNGIGFVYVYADHTRINGANNLSPYLAWWTYTIDRDSIVSNKIPTQNPTLSDLTDLQNYLVTNTGFSLSRIATFLRNLFDAQDNAQLQTWILSNSRLKTVNKLAEAFSTQEQSKL